ncbi:MAG: L,D-transpeptidase [Candidatus Gracilibacteria bacterium]
MLTIFFASFTFVVTLLLGIFNNDHLQVSLFNKPLVAAVGVYFDTVVRIDPEAYSLDGEVLEASAVLGKYGEWSFCQYEMPETPEYSVQLNGVEVEEGIQGGQVFSVSMSFVNAGNTRLFADDANCYGLPVFNVGTQKAQDRASIFGDADHAVTGWVGTNRIQMSEDYVDPWEEFHVNFQSVAPMGDNIYREFFKGVIEDKAWIGSDFGVDITVGTPTEQMQNDISFVTDISVDAGSLSGLERSLEIVLADQTMFAKFGDIAVWSMPVSSGAWATPTPRGAYKVLTKQELRVGQAYPNYRMPYFQLWDWRGYGIHALPYLVNDGGTFWSEALEHIGTPVSHGCVRTLPEDAETAYNFTNIGTPVNIR